MKRFKTAGAAGALLASMLVWVLSAPAGAADKGMSWLKKECPNGALGYNYGGGHIIEVSTGKKTTLGGSRVEFSTKGSFFASCGNQIKVLARKTGEIKDFAKGAQGQIAWISDFEFVAYTGSWKIYNVLTGKTSTPKGLSGGQVKGNENDLKMTEKGHWVRLGGSKTSSNSPDFKSQSRPGRCSGSLSPYGYHVGGLISGHVRYEFRALRTGAKSGKISWKVSCNKKGMDNNRFSSTSADWIVYQNECKSTAVVHQVSSNDYACLGKSGGTKQENYGDFSHLGPVLDFSSSPSDTGKDPTPVTYRAPDRAAAGSLVSRAGNGDLVITLQAGGKARLFGADGSLVRSIGGSTTITRSSLPTGTYFIDLRESGERTMEKFSVK